MAKRKIRLILPDTNLNENFKRDLSTDTQRMRNVWIDEKDGHTQEKIADRGERTCPEERFVLHFFLSSRDLASWRRYGRQALGLMLSFQIGGSLNPTQLLLLGQFVFQSNLGYMFWPQR